MKDNPDSMRLTANSLNLVLHNHKLNQIQKQSLIGEILSEELSFRGYIDSVKMDEHV